MHFVKTSRFLAVLLLCFSSCFLLAQVMAPAPAGGYTIAPLTGHYGHGHGQCVLDEHFQPVHHTG
ncbi:MAG: hypothetical protein AAFN92_16205, partial [Bacteroidota bacterium]